MFLFSSLTAGSTRRLIVEGAAELLAKLEIKCFLLKMAALKLVVKVETNQK